MLLDELMSTVPTTTGDALELFDAAPAVEPGEMIGTWRGAELPTGHPIDGLLAASGWWGKQFVDAETVHPLLFRTSDGSALWPMKPVLAFAGVPFGRFSVVKNRSYVKPIAMSRLAWQTRSPKARLRTTRYRGVDTATMIYDQLPINDVFHRLSDDAVLGAMDMRGSEQPYFFVLRRDDTLRMRT
ncbi:DUF4334 domain-containing protein [Gordonia rhizosphera]|uniref:DUF4334 domain-containing protein n=1 Tax=Gordonia rhizosphera NBRC 16068 TaxID=1108045 RepID=K6W3I4_9ACTN|nr:DUF4334 domain-containing protein [Gordonia rhizosphera]GAB93720.1 hypothetical protein GORHZ_242_00040 [Gordonia rhizosphera NBRC 16068]